MSPSVESDMSASGWRSSALLRFGGARGQLAGGNTGLVLAIIVAVVAAALGYLVARGGTGWQVLLLVAAASVGAVALRWIPAVAAGAYTVAILATGLFSERAELGDDLLLLGGGVRLQDALLGALLVSALVFALSHREEVKAMPGGWVMALFLVLLTAQVVRNLGPYGWSALGEFRFRYMAVFAAPAFYFMCRGLSAGGQLRVLRTVLLVPLLAVALAVPLSGYLYGWDFGPSSRFLHSSVALALLEALVCLSILRVRGVWKVPAAVLVPGWMIAAVLIVVDGHRSVWLVGAVVLGTALVARIVRPHRWLLLVAAIGAAAIVVGGLLYDGLDLFGSYLATRSLAFVRYSQDPNSVWRARAWAATVRESLKSPVFGVGFGGYWGDIYVPESGSTLGPFPHNLYVMTLYKTGAVGLAALVGLLARVLRSPLSWLSAVASYRRRAIAACTILVVAATTTYGLAYGVDAYAWVLIGVFAALLAGAEEPDDLANGGNRA
jgi:O-antigen ligase